MKNSASIQIKGSGSEVSFVWQDFDGDDCFRDFHIDVIEDRVKKRFDFGACAVYGLRKVAKFFRDATETCVSGGFRSPDLRLYDVTRISDGYLLSINSKTSGVSEHEVRSASVQIDDEFLEQY